MRDSKQIKQFHLEVFNSWQNRIPLIVCPPCPELPVIDEYWHNLDYAISQTMHALAPKIAVEADWIPTINVGIYQCIAIPSLYGSQVKIVSGSEPICSSCFDNLTIAVKAGTKNIQGPIIDRMFRDLKQAQALTSQNGFDLSFPASASPFDLAMLMLGEEFLVGMCFEPDHAAEFLMNLTEVSIELYKLVLEKLGKNASNYITNRGLAFPGLRLACDSIVNYSPDMIRKFVLPVLDEFGKAFGNLCIHFCTEPSPSHHILPILLENKYIKAIDNWQGPDVFLGEKAPAMMQSSIAVISSLDLDENEKIDKFLAKPAIKTVPRLNGRGLVFSTNVSSIKQGKSVYEYWHKQF